MSPDGEWIGFFSSGTLKKVAITGGPSQVLTRTQGAPRGATWGPDDTIIFATSALASGLLRVSAKDGGSPAIVTRPDQAKREGSYVRPWFLPGGQAVLFTINEC